jgi:NAD(P)-dependent dehydrogenase (short-subunit alcohol dehydrogenase family)
MATDGASFSGRVVLVTGVDRPLGELLARRLAAEGGSVALACAVAGEGVAHLQRELQASGGFSLVVSGDLGDEEHARGLVDEVRRRLGPPTDAVLVVRLPSSSTEPLAGADGVFRASVLELFGLLRWLLPAISSGAAPGGSISLVVEAGRTMPAEQAAAVGAVAAMTRSLGRSLASRRLRINAVIRTDDEDDESGRGTVAERVLAFADPSSARSGEVVGGAD